MKKLSLSDAKRELGSLVDAVGRSDQRVVIIRNGRPAAVLISPDEFESWKETVAVRNQPELLEEIKKGLAALQSKRARLYTLEELLG
ncbi:MAG: hypothetical protein KatS3mg076_1346 [Candidatus Binatia bacterium]|nr:MAG: hypothetical protein KatS3mg076_1346 [Candidatus Binatia bacterium]